MLLYFNNLKDQFMDDNQINSILKFLIYFSNFKNLFLLEYLFIIQMLNANEDNYLQLDLNKIHEFTYLIILNLHL